MSSKSATRRQRSAQPQSLRRRGRSRARTPVVATAIAGAAVLIIAAAVFWLSQKPAVTVESTSGPVAGVTVQGNGGSWTNITPDQLASLLEQSPRSFTLVNVKTPYLGEIDGTDLYIPYDQLAARASELPPDRSAPLVVYCRSGHESAIAAQVLLDLGYRAILNLDGGMNAWTASGRALVQKQRS